MWKMDDMPRRRSECLDRKRPCPWVRCRHHFIWLVWNKLRDRSNNEIADYITKLKYSCVLDIIDKHREMTLEQIAQLLNLSRERVRQIEEKAIRKVRVPTWERVSTLVDLRDTLILS